MINNELIKTKITNLTSSPGVYLMLDKSGKIIYVGKAKNLQKRVSQYFLRPQVGKVAAMVKRIVDFNVILTNTEKEALILELNLIKIHYPRYNILLKDGSHYPYIALTRHGDPIVKIARKATDKNMMYWGPFPISSSAYQVVDLTNKLFMTRKCPPTQKGPCLYYHLGQCPGYCINTVSDEQRNTIRKQVINFLNGNDSEIISEYKSKMLLASEKLDFENAKEYKFVLDSLQHIFASQQSETKSKTDEDVFAFTTRDEYLGLAVMIYRQGKLLGKEFFCVSLIAEEDELVTNLILQYYQNKKLPNFIIVGNQSVARQIRLVLETKVVVPKAGNKLDLINIAQKNVKDSIDEHFLTARLDDDKDELLSKLGDLLNAPFPKQIDLFDNAHLGGADSIGVVVTYINGIATKKLYRKYNISQINKQDDYGALKEVMTRHFKRKLEDNTFIPDLVIVDGGIGQLNAAKEVKKQLNLPFTLAGLFKNDKHQTKGLLNEEGRIVELKSSDKIFFFLTRMQDEVHRFAITSHRGKRAKSMYFSIFDTVKGLGLRRKQIIVESYPTLEDINKASIDELSQLIPKEVALNLKEQVSNFLAKSYKATSE